MYNPVIGRWISPDPIGMGNGDLEIVYSHEYVARRLQGQLRSVSPLNSGTTLYVYASSNPVNRVDPSGLADCKLKLTAILRENRPNERRIELQYDKEQCLKTRAVFSFANKRIFLDVDLFDWKTTGDGAIGKICTKATGCSTYTYQCVKDDCCEDCLPTYPPEYSITVKKKFKDGQVYFERSYYSCVFCYCPELPAVAPKPPEPPAIAPKP